MNIFKNLWDLAITLIENISNVWEWLNKAQKIGFTLIPELDLGLFTIPEIGLSWTFIPIQLLGIGIGTLILLWFIKSLIPLG